MKAASVGEIKKELAFLEPGALQSLCLRLAKFKVENKELLTYLLFEAGNEAHYLENAKATVAGYFDDLRYTTNLYLAKKSIRKILRFVNKQIKFSGLPQTDLELRIFFCTKLKDAPLNISHSAVLVNLYQQQLKKIGEVLAKLPEDLQYDYQKEIHYIAS